MKNVISYVLFGTEPRYWCNIPYMLVANSVIYPEFVTRVYVHLNSTQVPAFEFLKKAVAQFPNVEMQILDEEYQATGPTTWRMRPLWEDDIDILLCRDLDHITNKLEREAVQYFLDNKQHFIQGIRSYHLHSVPYLAGLVGFRCKDVRNHIRHMAKSFEEYILWGIKNVDYCSDWRWGCDQALLRDFFGKAQLYEKTLDCPQFTATEKIAFYQPTKILSSAYENIQLSDCNIECLLYSDSIAPSFTGQAVNAHTDQVRELIAKADNEIAKLAMEYI